MGARRVAITGGSGRLGRFVVDEVAGHAAVTVLDLAPGGSGHPFVRTDVRDLDAVLAALDGHDAVIHLAAIDDGVPASDHTYFQTNAQGTWNVLHAAHTLGIPKAAITSSTAAYGIGRGEIEAKPRYLPIDEAHPLCPDGVYSLSKEVAETIGRGFARRGVTRIACLRPTLVVRPEVVGQLDNMARLAAGDPAAVADYDTAGLAEPHKGPLPYMRAYVRPHDVARAFRLAIEVDGAPFDIFNVAARDTVGRIDTLAHMERVLGAPPEVRKPELYAADPTASPLDIGHARDVLGWQPQGTWDDYVAACSQHLPR